jgi:hypothetical protein
MTRQDTHDNVTLLVSNQSFDVNPVDIKVSIDGKTIVKDKFDVQGEQPPQHNWRQYHLRLEDGPHSLVAESKKGRAQLQTPFEVAGQHTILIAYWHGRRSARGKSEGYFTVESGPRQVATM